MLIRYYMSQSVLPLIAKRASLISIYSSSTIANTNDIKRTKSIGVPLMHQRANYLHRCQHHLAHEGKNTRKDLSTSPPSAKKLKKKESYLNFVSSRTLKFLDRYQKLLETKFPTAMKVYRVFVIGFKDFTIETKDYLNIQRRVIMTSTKVTDLSRKDIDIYYRMPCEMLRVAPTLLISALPLANYIVLPIAYCFPKKLLSSHFWTLQQKSQYALEFHKQKVLNFRPLFRHLQLNVDQILTEDLKQSFQDALFQLGCGDHPTCAEILELRFLFEKDRFSLKAIHGPHVKSLCKINGIERRFLRRRKLYDHAEMLRSLDTVLARDGLDDLKTDELKTACFMRGLNPSNLDNMELRKYLDSWLCVSLELNSRSNSLLLHLPILLSYNHPNNWALLRSKKL